MEFQELLNPIEYQLYSNLSSYAIKIGYKKQIAKTKDLIHLYLHPKTKERVLKFSHSNKYGFSIHLKYDKSKSYSHFFHEAVRKTIEESEWAYTGCYSGCRKCDGSRGYTYTYEDGRSYFRCYQELIELSGMTNHELEDTKQLLLRQLSD